MLHFSAILVSCKSLLSWILRIRPPPLRSTISTLSWNDCLYAHGSAPLHSDRWSPHFHEMIVRVCFGGVVVWNSWNHVCFLTSSDVLILCKSLLSQILQIWSPLLGWVISTNPRFLNICNGLWVNFLVRKIDSWDFTSARIVCMMRKLVWCENPQKAFTPELLRSVARTLVLSWKGSVSLKIKK